VLKNSHLIDDGLALLVGESIVSSGTGRLSPECSHVICPGLRWKWARTLPGSARPMPADCQIVLSCFGAFARVFLCLPLREAERRNGAEQGAPFWKAPRLPLLGRQARLPALHRGDLLRDHRTSAIGPEGFTTPFQAAFALPFIRSCPATKGGPLIGAGRWPRLLGRGCEPRLQAPPSPLRRPNASGGRPQWTGTVCTIC